MPAPQNGEIYPRRTGELNNFYVDTAIRSAPKHTGYVPNLAEPETRDTQAFKLFSTHHEDPKLAYGSTFQQQATIRVHTATPLNQSFFSDANIQHLQDEIRYRVWEKSGRKHVIGQQKPDDLKTIMRAYYLQYQINDEKNVAKELSDLNERVLKFCVDDVLGSINMYLYNRSQILNYPDQIDRPVNAKIYGTKGAELKAFF